LRKNVLLLSGKISHEKFAAFSPKGENHVRVVLEAVLTGELVEELGIDLDFDGMWLLDFVSTCFGQKSATGLGRDNQQEKKSTDP
jgi:hypothetical protein